VLDFELFQFFDSQARDCQYDLHLDFAPYHEFTPIFLHHESIHYSRYSVMDTIRSFPLSDLLQTVGTAKCQKYLAKLTQCSIFRRMTLARFRRFQADDWLMVLVLIPYTASIISTNQVGTEHSTVERKYRYVLEETQVITTWLVKTCLVILYWRIL
jgi:hypothetical protein